MSRIVVLASGSGTNLQALIDALREDIVAVFCNRPDAMALTRAQQHGIDAHCHRLRPWLDEGHTRADYDAALADAVLGYHPDLVVLAGWMHIFTPAFLDRFGPEQIVNLHPALLPQDPQADRVLLPDGSWSPVFRGAHALEDAMAAGVPYVGSSVHYVTAAVDRGRLIAQKALAVDPGESFDSVRSRLLALEHELLPATVQKLLAIRTPA